MPTQPLEVTTRWGASVEPALPLQVSTQPPDPGYVASPASTSGSSNPFAGRNSSASPPPYS